jgi:3-hydroxymyristoyl/3-hydroxydecanoyl-(acyl carrier protein) dehydratase
MKVKFLKRRAGFFKLSGEAFVNDLLVAEAEMMANILSVEVTKGE